MFYARPLGAFFALTVLLPVLASGEGVGGDEDSCAVLGPRGIGLGDCDGDQECQAGLVCQNNFRANYGFLVDVCEIPLLQDPGGANYCAVTGPCGAGEGDCDGNHEVEAGLIYQNNVGGGARLFGQYRCV